ncbi:DUF885 domain-containing protein [Granulicella paludicola]|uniref:DUF885 domain-containing protein n=1 Tax=Granulicella paludicola TaxID=474951 RepID=UPI0021E072F1|nr:DUF885 domain-containing protein [Granulicella paludicola]
MRFPWVIGLGVAAVALMVASPAMGESDGSRASTMRPVIEQYSADNAALEQTYSFDLSRSHMQRFKVFYASELESLSKIDFDRLNHEDQVDYLLLRNLLMSKQHQWTIRQRQIDEMQPLLPFEKNVETLLDAKRLMQRPEGEKSAALLVEMTKQIAAARKQLDPGTQGARKIDPVVANRAVHATREISEALHDWFGQYDGYDPTFTWWVEQPYKDLDKSLKDYSAFLKEKLIGIAPDDKTTIIGDPVGRDALLADLQDNLIPYTPEELTAIAQTEYDWCMKEMLKASHEMGYGDNWHAAVEKVKTMHVAPGEQPELIRKLVVEGSDFVKKNDLVTVPPLADETWRMIMMTPERQLVNPFFTGGDEISVSYPTDTMTFDQREMSMRGNNIPFARATAFHEMIPGHFLQFYMSERYNVYRQPFETPFWVEGNSLYWEMLFWDKGFEHTPEERVGALVWRMHRSARVIFTMNFHLGKWTPQQCVQFLIDAVGFEPDNATAEVRRSFDGSVGPLYQSAYLMGALQLRALRHELVDSKKMSERQFHDTILHENAMPIELLRADMEGLKLTRDYKTNWAYYGPHPTHP